MFSIQRTPDDNEVLWVATVRWLAPSCSKNINLFNSGHFTLPLCEVRARDVSTAEPWHTGYWPWFVKMAFLFKNHFAGGRKEQNKIHWESLVIEIFGWVTPCHSFIWSWLNSKRMRGSWKMAERPLELCKESTNYWWWHLCCLILQWSPTVIELNYWMCHKKHVLP